VIDPLPTNAIALVGTEPGMFIGSTMVDINTDHASDYLCLSGNKLFVIYAPLVTNQVWLVTNALTGADGCWVQSVPAPLVVSAM